MRKLTLSIDIDVDDSVTDDMISDEISAALKGISSKASSFGDLKILTIGREDKTRAAGFGYESKIWGKATC